jgi:CRISPR-associated protein Cas5h
MSHEFLIFDIWAEMAHFRRYDTTSSPLSWPFPPRPTVFGIMGAILGLPKETYLAQFQEETAEVAVSIQERPRSLRVAYNETETKGVKLFRTTRHTQIRREILADPRYRIFFRHPDQSLQISLTELVKAHCSVYTVSLGHASMLADFAFVASLTPKVVRLTEASEIASVVPFDKARPANAPGAAPLLLNSMPRHMTPDRIVTSYQDVIYDARQSAVLVQPREGDQPALMAWDLGEIGLIVPL